MRFRDLLRRLLGVAAAVSLAGMSGCVDPATMQSDPRTLTIDAKHVLLSAMDDKDDFTRAEAVEALGLTLGEQCGNTYIQALQDPSPVVRFAAAIVLGDLKYEPAKPVLLRMAQVAKDGEPDKRVFAGVVYALYRLGNTEYTRKLGPLLFDPEWEVRANVALVMGKTGDERAILPLKALRSTERTAAVQIQLKDSLALLGDMGALESIEGFARSSIYLDERVPAIQALGHLRDRRGVYLLRNMVRPQEPVLVRLAAAGALAQLGTYNAQAYDFCIQTIQDPVEVLSHGGKIGVRPEDASKAATLAAISLGHLGNASAVDTLRLSLRTADGQVRVAAAKSILMLLAGYGKPQPSQPPVKPVPPVVKPQPPVKPPTPTTKPAPPVKPPTPATKPAPPVKPVTPATKPAPPVKPVTPATKPAPPVKPPTPTTKPAPPVTTAPAKPVEKPSTTRPKLITSGAKD